MKRRIARKLLIARLAALALITLCFSQAAVRAQGMTAVIVIFPSVGLAPGESLRLTLFNPAGEPVRVQARLHHTGGMLVGLTDGSVRGGASRSFDFERGDIPLPGEEDTGRIQLSASFDIRVAERLGPIDPLAVSMETISISDGTSNTVLVGEITPSRSGEQTISLPEGVLIGLVPGQRVRLTLTNPPSYGTEAGSEAKPSHVGGHVKVFDSIGNAVAQSDELVIPAGEFRSFDFNRDEIALPGEPGTHRVQARIKPFFSFSSGRLSPVLVSFEVVDNSTGKTRVLSGNQCLVFFLGGIPAN
jgi:hypothetical protein